MPARPDLEAKLATVDDWVRDSFAHLSDLLISMGCQHREVTAPGRSFRLGNGPSVHLHPKQSYIGVGLPRSMQEDVEALSAYPHRKDGPAWVRYGPDDVDRDTMELLLSSAVVRGSKPVATSAPGSGPPPAAASSVPVQTAPNQDHDDLQLIWNILRSYDEHRRAVTSPRPVRIIREVLFFVWEAPRLPKGGKRSRYLPHSPAARAQRLTGDDSGLVYEHVMPISLVIKDLLVDPPGETASLRNRLDATSDRVIILKREDRALDLAGWRNALPDPENPWSRYRAIGLDPSDFQQL
jgi:hypothetical protein